MSQSAAEPAVVTNKRADERYQVSIPVDCSTLHMFISNHVNNISRGGLFLASDTPLPLNAEVSLVLRLPTAGTSIHATGRVAWNYDVRKGTSRIVPGSGIRFVEMGPADRATLEAYLERLSRPVTS
jgi:type IV pilus assembly protein PilZ